MCWAVWDGPVQPLVFHRSVVGEGRMPRAAIIDVVAIVAGSPSAWSVVMLVAVDLLVFEGP
jgi:hypothetical protein